MLQKETIEFGEGGEILKGSIQTIKKVNAEEFCQVYLRDNEEFYQLSKAEANVLAVCWAKSIYYNDPEFEQPGNLVLFNNTHRDFIKQKTGLADSTIKNAFSSLVKKEMLIKDEKCKSQYFLNPKYFFKGQISTRTKLIEKTICYEVEN